MGNADDIQKAIIKQLESSRHLTAAFTKELDAAKTVIAQFDQIGEQHRMLQEKLEESLRPFREVGAQLSTAFLDFKIAAASTRLNFLTIEIPDVVADVRDQFDRISGLVADAFRDLPQRTRKELRVLAGRGWYVDGELPANAPGILVDELEGGRVDEIDAVLVEYFRDRLLAIKERLVQQYPHRATFLDKAFKAHERGEYELSVPVLLAQADGICKDCTNLLLFRGKDRRPEIASYVQETFAADEYRAALLSPLTEEHPISATEARRPADFEGLNRHLVLHGESLTYHTEVNSLKAVSLLSYLIWVLDRDQKGSHPEHPSTNV